MNVKRSLLPTGECPARGMTSISAKLRGDHTHRNVKRISLGAGWHRQQLTAFLPVVALPPSRGFCILTPNFYMESGQ